MQNYQAPLQDMQFVLYDVMKIDRLWQSSSNAMTELDRDTANAMLEEAAKLMANVISPINRTGDEQGVQWKDGQVTTPDGFRDAYKMFADGGWSALTGNSAYGGLGMPKSFAVLVEEMLYGANSSFALYPGLSAGACLAIDAHASAALKEKFLPNLYSGLWSGTMCLTEPHAGSDLGLIRTKAEPEIDGTFRITGTKIFITGGDHDLAENIIHLVLAKLPNAAAGSKGISLFLVPKFWVNSRGGLDGANGVTCGSIEHKMGIKASATCVMNFDSARGFLIGEPNKGLQCMFTMMNCERLSIGLQGIGCSEMSYQNAVAYARERLQGRDSQAVATAAAPIIVHPDVRRMLLTMKSTIEAGRALAVYVGAALDQSKSETLDATRARAEMRVALLTPVAKAFFTDMGLENTVLGQQIFGGHGYIREWGQEQLVRDVRIAQIYEGTNGIQALDLIQRKVFHNQGEYLTDFLSEVEAFIENGADASTALYGEKLKRAVSELKDLTQYLIRHGKQNPDELAAAATDYLQMLGLVAYGYMWLKMMSASVETSLSQTFRDAKWSTGQFFFNRLLTRIETLATNIRAGSEDLMRLDAAGF